MQGKKIIISAGEVSGDEHASKIVEHLREALPDVTIRGMGGTNLRRANVDTVVDSETSASVMGFGELFGSISKIRASLKEMKNLLKDWKPDLLITVDYQEFHFMLMKAAKQLGIPTLHFVSPSIWAWRSGRTEKVKKYCDKLALIYPFEKKMYEEVGYQNSMYVGHPFADEFPSLKISTEEALSFREELGLSKTSPTLAIFLGSRKKEFINHAPTVMKAFLKAKEEIPNLQAILPLPDTISQDLIDKELSGMPACAITRGNSIKAMQSADYGIIKSGTSNLQAAFCGLPFTMYYLGGYLTDFIVRYFVRIDQYSIINVIRTNTVREVIQEEFRPSTFTREMLENIQNQKKQGALRKELLEIANELSSFEDTEIFNGSQSAPERVARMALDMLK